jgi:hypothetical protein
LREKAPGPPVCMQPVSATAATTNIRRRLDRMENPNPRREWRLTRPIKALHG